MRHFVPVPLPPLYLLLPFMHCVLYKSPIPSGSWPSCVLQGVNGCLQNCQGSSSMRDTEKCHFSGPTDQPGLEIIFFTLVPGISDSHVGMSFGCSLTRYQSTDLAGFSECQAPNPHPYKKRHFISWRERERLFCMFYKGGNLDERLNNMSEIKRVGNRSEILTVIPWCPQKVVYTEDGQKRVITITIISNDNYFYYYRIDGFPFVVPGSRFWDKEYPLENDTLGSILRKNHLES